MSINHGKHADESLAALGEAWDVLLRLEGGTAPWEINHHLTPQVAGALLGIAWCRVMLSALIASLSPPPNFLAAAP